jgi:nitroreductase
MLDSRENTIQGGLMNVIEAIRTRRSIRAFKSDPVPKKTIQEILDIGRWAPSGGDVQPWHFVVLSGKFLENVKNRLVEKAKTWDGTFYQNTNPDMPRSGPYSPFLEPRWQKQRAIEDAVRFPPGTKNLEAKQLERREHMLRFFDAPTAIIVCAEDHGVNSIISIGAICQTICLTALTYGLGTCIMGIPVLWPEIFRELLNIPKDKTIITSIAIGHPDLKAPINNFQRPREPLDNLVEWYI